MTERNSGRESIYRDEEVSLLALGTMLLRQRWRVARWMLVGGVVAALSVIAKPALYLASASFVPQGNDASRMSGMASLAGQLGVSLPTANASQSPEFYARLLRSRVVLEAIVRDTFVVEEMGRKRVAFVDLFQIEGTTPKYREEQGVGLLRSLVTPAVAKTTGGVDVSVATEWPSVSLAIVTALVKGVDDFNQRTRQGQAAVERKFVEGRLTVARAALREAEDRLGYFLRANRQIDNSPELVVNRDRMQRDLMLTQQVYTTLAQSYEDVRIREVRDTPVITVLEPPFVPTLPQPRGRIASVLFGLMLGAFFGVVLSFSAEMLARRRREGSAEANDLIEMLEGMKGGALKRIQRLSLRS